MECLAIYHTAFEDLGSFAVPLRERGYAIRYRHPGAEPPAPEEWLRPDLVAVLGGPIGVGDTAGYPWLRANWTGCACAWRTGGPRSASASARN
jgi:GMP synthase (glutamine-hydrolysing)